MRFFLILLTLSTFVQANNPSPQEIEKLKKGELLKQVINLPNEIWPKVIMTALIPHSPKENITVMSDYEAQKNYIPDMKKSKIVEKISDNATNVEFVLGMPWPVEDSKYTTTNIIEQSGENFKLRWHLVKANQMKATQGSMDFVPFEGKTLFTYTTHISPDSSFAGLFKSRVESDVEKTVKVIIKHLDKTITSKK